MDSPAKRTSTITLRLRWPAIVFGRAGQRQVGAVATSQPAGRWGPGYGTRAHGSVADPGWQLWLVESHKFLSQNRYGRKVVLIYTHPGVIDASKFIGRNQRSKKPEEMAKL